MYVLWTSVGIVCRSSLAVTDIMFIRARDVADVGSGQNFDRIWPDLEQLSSMVIFFNNS